MITKEELEEYKKIRGFKNLGLAEKDYFQNIILFIISQNFGKTLIFKGGTALNKCYGLPRFSEDLDFNAESKIELKIIEENLKKFNIDFEIESKDYSDETKAVIRIKGPLYIGIKNSMCSIILDISLREKTVLSPKIKTIGRFLNEIPSFDILIMDEEEILAEKVRAVFSRDKARDVYDLNFLLEKNIRINKELINNKLKYYNLEFNIKSFEKKINQKKEIWNTELKSLIDKMPDFNEVKKKIIDDICNLMK